MTKVLDAPIHAVAGFTEPLASCLHLAAALVALWLTYPLIRAGRTRAARVGIGVFSLGSVFLFAMSGTYHLLPMQTVARAVLLRLDHAAIWVMIAGTITALQMTSVTGVWRWAMTGLTWSAAITGLVLKTVYFHEPARYLSCRRDGRRRAPRLRNPPPSPRGAPPRAASGRGVGRPNQGLERSRHGRSAAAPRQRELMVSSDPLASGTRA